MKIQEATDASRDRTSRHDEAIQKLSHARSRKNPDISLHEFLRDTWSIIEPDHPFIDGWHIRGICDHVQAALCGYEDPETGDWRDDLDKLVVNCPPGVSKSVICSIAAPCWAWTFRPTYRFLLLSFSDDLATFFSSQRRLILMSDYYLRRWPLAGETSQYGVLGRQLQRSGRDTAHQTMNLNGGEMRTTTVGGKVTGYHPNVVIFDDPIEPPDGKRLLRPDPHELRVFPEWYRSKFVTRGYADDIRRRIILVGQRACLGDPTDVLIGTQGRTEHLCLPMRFDPEHPVRDPSVPTCLGFIDPRKEAGQLLCPDRISLATVDETCRILGTHNAAAQMQQAPIKASGGYIRRGWFADKIIDNLPEGAHITRMHRHWDLAATEGGGDFTVGLKMCEFTLPGQKDLYYFVDHISRDQWGASERDKNITTCAIGDGRQCTVSIEKEPGSGGKTQAEAIVRMLRGIGMNASVYPAPRKGKFMAADGFVAALEDGRIFCRNAPWLGEYIDELCSLQRDIDGQRDDQLDGSSGAFNSITARTKFLISVV